MKWCWATWSLRQMRAPGVDPKQVTMQDPGMNRRPILAAWHARAHPSRPGEP